MSIPRSIILFVTVLLVSCSSSDTPDEVTEPPIENVSYCTRYDAEEVAAMNGNVIGTFQADLQAGDRLVVIDDPTGVLNSFNELTGEYTYQVPRSRVADVIIYEHRNALDQTLGVYQHHWVAEPLRIMPLGDSITSGVDFYDGIDSPPLPLRIGYRKALYEALVANGTVIDFIGQGGQRAGQDAGLIDPDNNGYSGVDIAFIQDKVLNIFNEGPSDVVLLHIGTNSTPADAQGILAILDEIGSWAAQNNPVVVLVATLVPKRADSQQIVVDQFNADLRDRLRAESRENVILVEQALALTVDDISTESVGVHPNPGGYLKMADTWYASLLENGIIATCLDETEELMQ